MPTVSQDRRQGVNAGAALKVPVRVATTSNITLSGLQTIDGVTVATDDRVLVKNQTDASQNGIYVADTSTWDRAIDFDSQFDVVRGTVVFVNEGSTNASLLWRVVSDDPITIDEDEIEFDTVLIPGEEFTDVTTFGATGNGTTDDTVAVQNAFDAVGAAGGGVVYFPEGTYLLSNAGIVTYRSTSHNYCIKVKSNTTVRFAGGVTIKLAASANSHLFVNSDISGAGNSNIAFYGPVTFDGNQSNQTSPSSGEQSLGLFYNVNRSLKWNPSPQIMPPRARKGAIQILAPDR